MLCKLSVLAQDANSAVADAKEISTRNVLQALRPTANGAVRLVEVRPDARRQRDGPDDRVVVVDSCAAAVQACEANDATTVVLVHATHVSCDWHALQLLKRSAAVTRVVAFASGSAAGTGVWSPKFVANCVSLCGPTETAGSDTPGCSDEKREHSAASAARKVSTVGESFAAVHACMGIASGSYCLAVLLSKETCDEVSPLASIPARCYCFKCGSAEQRASGASIDGPRQCRQCDAAKALAADAAKAEAVDAVGAEAGDAVGAGAFNAVGAGGGAKVLSKANDCEETARLSQRRSRRVLALGVLISALVLVRLRISK